MRIRAIPRRLRAICYSNVPFAVELRNKYFSTLEALSENNLTHDVRKRHEFVLDRTILDINYRTARRNTTLNDKIDMYYQMYLAANRMLLDENIGADDKRFALEQIKDTVEFLKYSLDVDTEKHIQVSMIERERNTREHEEKIINYKIYSTCNDLLNPGDALKDSEKNFLTNEKNKALEALQAELKLDSEEAVQNAMVKYSDLVAIASSMIPNTHTPISEFYLNPVKFSSPSQYHWMDISFKWLSRRRGQMVSVDKYGKDTDRYNQTQFFDAFERDEYRVILRNGKFYQLDSKKMQFNLFSTTKIEAHNKSGYGAITISHQGEISIFPHFGGTVLHSSIQHQKSLFYAGEIKITNGQIEVIIDHSGHYKPKPSNVYALLKYLEDRDVNIDNIVICLQTNLSGAKESEHLIPEEVGLRYNVLEKRMRTYSAHDFIKGYEENFESKRNEFDEFKFLESGDSEDIWVMASSDSKEIDTTTKILNTLEFKETKDSTVELETRFMNQLKMSIQLHDEKQLENVITEIHASPLNTQEQLILFEDGMKSLRSQSLEVFVELIRTLLKFALVTPENQENMISHYVETLIRITGYESETLPVAVDSILMQAVQISPEFLQKVLDETISRTKSYISESLDMLREIHNNLYPENNAELVRTPSPLPIIMELRGRMDMTSPSPSPDIAPSTEQNTPESMLPRQRS